MLRALLNKSQLPHNSHKTVIPGRRPAPFAGRSGGICFFLFGVRWLCHRCLHTQPNHPNTIQSARFQVHRILCSCYLLSGSLLSLTQGDHGQSFPDPKRSNAMSYAIQNRRRPLQALPRLLRLAAHRPRRGGRPKRLDSSAARAIPWGGHPVAAPSPAVKGKSHQQRPAFPCRIQCRAHTQSGRRSHQRLGRRRAQDRTAQGRCHAYSQVQGKTSRPPPPSKKSKVFEPKKASSAQTPSPTAKAAAKDRRPHRLLAKPPGASSSGLAVAGPGRRRFLLSLWLVR